MIRLVRSRGDDDLLHRMGGLYSRKKAGVVAGVGVLGPFLTSKTWRYIRLSPPASTPRSVDDPRR